MKNIGQQNSKSRSEISVIALLKTISTKKLNMTMDLDNRKHLFENCIMLVKLLIFHIDVPMQSQTYLNATALIAFSWFLPTIILLFKLYI